MDLQGKVAFITGGTRGIGESVARQFAAEGAAVAIIGRNEERGRDVAASIEAASVSRTGKVRFVATDVTDEEQIRTAVAETVEAFGGLHILVNNAAATALAIGDRDKPLAQQSTADFDEIIKVSVYGTFWCSKYAIPEIVRSGGGSIVNVSSLASLFGLKSTPSYSAAKGAVNALTRQIAVDYAADNIRANVVVLGVIGNELMTPVVSIPEIAEIVQGLQLTRIGTNEDVSSFVTYLVSEKGSYLTGGTFVLDGGASAKGNYPTVEMITEMLTNAG